MFSTTGLFRSIPCPGGDSCELPNCFFVHELPVAPAAPTSKAAAPQDVSVIEAQREFTAPHEEGKNKRRKIESTPKQILEKSDNAGSQKSEQKVFTGTLALGKTGDDETVVKKANTLHAVSRDSTRLVETGRRQVSPPPVTVRNGAKSTAKSSTKDAKPKVKESLNPRMIPNVPASHGTRLLYLKKLHQEMMRLNSEVLKDADPETKALHLDDDELIRAALDEEEKIARNNPAVYANIIKLRMVAYKRMALEEWKKLRIESTSQLNKATINAKGPPPIETGLKPAEEVLVVRRLVANQNGLDKYGYVTKPPTEQDMEAAQRGVEASAGWEICDRCKSRFQVFPDRREDGALTSGGACTHHWGRIVRPSKDPTDSIKGHREITYSCCNDPIGTSGCTVAPTHVYKIAEPKRLASVMPFEQTPSNELVSSDRAVCFDCEMGYTVHGLELIRLSATSWPEGEPLIDVLVRPIGAILDLNSRFSGVFPEDFANALPHQPGEPPLPASMSATDERTPQGIPRILKVVSSPQSARALLFSFLSPSTPLLGHALENDLNATRIVHPTIIDTVLLFPHQRGLPLRHGLKQLAKRHLQKDIQMAGAAGHDSLEDARATGELVRWRVAREWKQLQKDGWTIRDGDLFPPLPADGSQPPKESNASWLLETSAPVESKRRKRKRARILTDGADETESEST